MSDFCCGSFELRSKLFPFRPWFSIKLPVRLRRRRSGSDLDEWWSTDRNCNDNCTVLGSNPAQPMADDIQTPDLAESSWQLSQIDQSRNAHWPFRPNDGSKVEYHPKAMCKWMFSPRHLYPLAFRADGASAHCPWFVGFVWSTHDNGLWSMRTFFSLPKIVVFLRLSASGAVRTSNVRIMCRLLTGNLKRYFSPSDTKIDLATHFCRPVYLSFQWKLFTI